MNKQPLHLSSEYYQGVAYEALCEGLTNEIAYYVGRAREFETAPLEAERYLQVIASLESIRSELNPDNKDALAVAHEAVKVFATLRDLK